MDIGIVGLGVVGGACKQGFELQSHTVKVHDITLDTRIEDLLETEIIYICVPTPSHDNGECDISNVEEIITKLKDSDYQGIVAIKSTVAPGTIDRYLEETNLRVCFVPEFLRERSAVDDFINKRDLLAVGTTDKDVFDQIVKSHGTLTDNCVMMKPIEAEILKYMNNVFNALRVTFANDMFDLCHLLDADYDKILSAFLSRNTASPDYMKCSDELRGYGGMCLPKDVDALIALFSHLGLNRQLFKAIAHDNSKVKTTVFPGMRNE